MIKKRNKFGFGKILLIAVIVIILFVCVGFYFKGITGNVALDTYLDTNYSAPYNLSNPDYYFFKISNNSLVAVEDTVNLSVNVSINGYIYQKGYIFNQGTHGWEIFNFDQVPVENSYWIKDFASKDLVINVSNRVNNNSETYIVAYACQKDSNGKWQCGCQSEGETDCRRWMLHSFNITNITAPLYLGCTEDANCSMTNGTCIAGLCVSKTKNPFPLGTLGNPFKITGWVTLDAVRNNLTASYILMNDLDENSANYSDYAGPSANSGAGWNPIGNNTTRFEGNFDGNGKTISELYINRLAQDLVGLFGNSTGNISNIGLEGVNITGKNYVGGLVGWQKSSAIIDSYLTGNLNGRNYIGGLIGIQESNMIDNSYAIGNIMGNSGVGGLIGYSYNSTILDSYSTENIKGNNTIGGLVGLQQQFSIITNSYSTENITGNNTVGGLVGAQDASSNILNSYSTGKITGDTHVGGLVGVQQQGSKINTSYALGNVIGNSSVGGLVAYLYSGYIYNSYALGNVTGSSGGYLGGLVGGAYASSNIYNCYSTGRVTGASSNIGGLIGASLSLSVTSSYWDMNTSGRTYSSAGGTGKNTTQMKNISTFSAWDSVNIWNLTQDEYPKLKF